MRVPFLIHSQLESAEFWSISARLGGEGSFGTQIHVSHLLDTLRYRPETADNARELLFQSAARVHDIAWMSFFGMRLFNLFLVHGVTSFASGPEGFADTTERLPAPAQEELQELVMAWTDRLILPQPDGGLGSPASQPLPDPADARELSVKLMALVLPLLARLLREFGDQFSGPPIRLGNRQIDPCVLLESLNLVEEEILEELSAIEWESDPINASMIGSVTESADDSSRSIPLHKADPGRLF